MENIAYNESWFGLFSAWFQGDRNAVKLAGDVLSVLHLWDDIVDGDAVSDVNNIFRKAIYDIPRNPVFQANLGEFTSALKFVVDQWEVANTFEAAKIELDKSYMLRAQVFQIFVLISEVVGGHEWKQKVAPEIWKAYGEDLPAYKEEMNNA